MMSKMGTHIQEKGVRIKKRMQFLNHDNNKYALHIDAREFLLSDDLIDAPLGIIAAIGEYRRGKSWITSQLVGDAKMFTTSSSVHAQTHGLWLASKTIETQHGHILVVDSEGTGSNEASADHDRAILTMVLMLSSTVVFNNPGALNSASLESLQLAATVGQMLQASLQSDVELSMPNLLFLLRDFTLQLIDKEQNAITATEYARNVLRAKPTMYEAMSEIFARIDAVAMPRPTAADSDLAHMCNLSPEFKTKLQDVVSIAREQTPIKKIQKSPLTGRTLVAVCDILCEAVNSGVVPQPTSMLQSLLHASMEKAINHALQAQQDMFSNTNVLPPNDYIEATVRALPQILAVHATSLETFSASQKSAATFVHQMTITLLKNVFAAADDNTNRWQHVIKTKLDAKLEIDTALLGAGTSLVVDGIQNELQSTRTALHAAQDATTNLTAELVSVTAAHQEMSNTFTKLDAQVKTRQEIANEDAVELRANYDAAKASIAATTTQFMDVKAHLAETNEENTAAKQKIVDLEQLLTTYKAKMADISAAKSNAQQQLQQVNTAIQQMQNALCLSKTESTRLRKVIDELQRDASESEQKHISDLRTLEAATNRLETQLAVATDRQEQFVALKKRKIEQQDVASIQLTELATQLQWFTQRRESDLATNAELKQRVATLENMLRQTELKLLLHVDLEGNAPDIH
jgi:hypothetical protein